MIDAWSTLTYTMNYWLVCAGRDLWKCNNLLKTRDNFQLWACRSWAVIFLSSTVVMSNDINCYNTSQVTVWQAAGLLRKSKCYFPLVSRLCVISSSCPRINSWSVLTLKEGSGPMNSKTICFVYKINSVFSPDEGKRGDFIRLIRWQLQWNF